MHLDHIPGDRRIDQRDRARAELERAIAAMSAAVPPRIVLGALISAARRLQIRIQGDDPIIRPRGRPRRAAP
jgi:hypothetical protein